MPDNGSEPQGPNLRDGRGPQFQFLDVLKDRDANLDQGGPQTLIAWRGGRYRSDDRLIVHERGNALQVLGAGLRRASQDEQSGDIGTS